MVTGCSKGHVGGRGSRAHCRSGMGYFMAIELASRGYKTFATARNVDKMEGLKEAGCTLLQLDVNDQASVDKARDEILGQISKDASLTIVNNAGVGHRKPIIDVDIEAAKKTYDTNVWAVLRVCQAFTPHMVAAGHGTLINVHRCALCSQTDSTGHLDRRLPVSPLCVSCRVSLISTAPRIGVSISGSSRADTPGQGLPS